MPARSRIASDTQRTFRNEDLMLVVDAAVDQTLWNEDHYEGFLDALCGSREYQKEAVRTTLRYLLGGRYANLRTLAQENFNGRPLLADRYATWERMQRSLQLPDQLSASLDLATGTGKSFVLYALAAIMLAEGAVDQVLVLCPSTTIEDGLLAKFRDLAGRADLRDLLPPDAKIVAPSIIRADESIVAGSLCVENFHAVLPTVGSSVRESLGMKGARTLVLNDEAHHVATESETTTRRWKEFLTDPAFGFRYVIGVSGTCYVKNDYFADVIYRYSLRQAMEDRIVKSVHYVAEMPNVTAPDEKWQIIRSRHEQACEELKPRGLLPLTIVVTDSIMTCKRRAEKLKGFLIDTEHIMEQEANRRVLCVHNNAPDLPRLQHVDDPLSRVEWIVSVSMLNEGWDVKRVFQIVPDEERAFDSKLLIAQVLGRGLRIPDGWTGAQPEVTVFNHDAWASRIEHLVNEVLELENRLTSCVRSDSPYHFDLHNIDYDRELTSVKKAMDRPYTLFEKGYVDLASDLVEEEVSVEYANAVTGARSSRRATIRRQSYTPREIAEVMYQRMEDAYLPDDPDPNRHYRYTDDWSLEKLEQMVTRSLNEIQMTVATDRMKQRFLAALGTLNRGESEYARYTPKPNPFVRLSTRQRQANSASQAELRNDKTFFYTDETRATLDEKQWPCFDEVTAEESHFSKIHVPDAANFKTPLNAAIADSKPETQFLKMLRDSTNLPHYDAWLKSTATGFYKIDYYWKKGEHPKSGEFNPDFFIKVGNLILVVEIKDDGELQDPSPENYKKNEYAIAHFNLLNEQLKEAGDTTRYRFNFLTPRNFNAYFQLLREGRINTYRSDLDAKLAEL